MAYWNAMVPELLVSDFNQLKHFYADLLGFSIRYERDQPQFAYLELGEAQIMIQQLGGDCWSVADMHAPFGRGVNLQIELAHIEKLYSRIKQTGHELFREKKRSAYKVGPQLVEQEEFLIQDPDGYLLRFCQCFD